ncbi:hypothetical protein OHA04_37950 [Streptomyces sp. NBC_01590]|uniref:hypothetical protein n=1 Tax=Streptomyces sp. NBC_01590 TaxID=2975887 RepID=UPI00386523D2
MGISRLSAAKRARTAAVLVAIATAATLAGPAPTASAGGSCTPGLCSQTWNNSGTGFYALKNWCRSGDGNGASTTTRPTCGTQKRDYLYPGDRTAGTKDWDVFQVDAGFCYKVYFEVDAGWDFPRTYDRRGKSTLWVKVANNGFAIVNSVRSSTC